MLHWPAIDSARSRRQRALPSAHPYRQHALRNDGESATTEWMSDQGLRLSSLSRFCADRPPQSPSARPSSSFRPDRPAPAVSVHLACQVRPVSFETVDWRWGADGDPVPNRLASRLIRPYGISLLDTASVPSRSPRESSGADRAPLLSSAEHHNRTLTRALGSPYRACYLMAICIFGVGILRDGL